MKHPCWIPLECLQILSWVPGNIPVHYTNCLVRDWSLITGRGELQVQNGKTAGPTFFAPPPSRQDKTFDALPFFKEWKLLPPHPFQYGKNFKPLRKNDLKTFCATPSAWLKLVAPPPHFVGVKFHMSPPPSHFVAPPPPPLT